MQRRDTERSGEWGRSVQIPSGGADDIVIELNKEAFARLRCKKEMKIVPGATHLFEEPGALEQASRLAAEWFKAHLQAQPRASAASDH